MSVTIRKQTFILIFCVTITLSLLILTLATIFGMSPFHSKTFFTITSPSVYLTVKYGQN